jgi:hypothetical protein
LYDLRLIALMMEAVQTSETLLNSHQFTRRYNPEDSREQFTLSSIMGEIAGTTFGEATLQVR